MERETVIDICDNSVCVCVCVCEMCVLICVHVCVWTLCVCVRVCVFVDCVCVCVCVRAHVCIQVFGDESNMYKLEDIQMQDFGQVGEVTVTKDDTLMMKVCVQCAHSCSVCLIIDTVNQ